MRTCKVFRVRNLKFARNLNFATSKNLCLKRGIFQLKKNIIYYNFFLLVCQHVVNFRCEANFTGLTLIC